MTMFGIRVVCRYGFHRWPTRSKFLPVGFGHATDQLPGRWPPSWQPVLVSHFGDDGGRWRSSPRRQSDHLAGAFAARMVARLPDAIRPYAQLMRLDKPTGTWLLLLPCWWSIALSTPAGSLPSMTNMALFGAGALMMRSAGCIINDIWDRKFDGQVERTKNRPLASNAIPVSDSIALLTALLGSSLLVLLQFDLKSILLGASSLSLVATYPAFKRFTYWPQLILGMAFNWGALLGWSVNCHGQLDLAAVGPLYVAGICWTMIYDTIYAHQDKRDDLVLGLKSTALKFGPDTRRYLYLFAALMAVSLLVCGWNTAQTWPYYGSVAGTTAALVRLTRALDVDRPESCARAFRQNTAIGWAILAGIVASTLYKNRTPATNPAGISTNGIVLEYQ